ncbi:MAG: DegV family protein [Filifactoraceae bacterium]
MNKTRVFVDGSTDLPKYILEKYNIGVVPLNVSFGEDSYIGGVNIDGPTFYSRMRQEKELPKTSCPSPEKFMESYGEEGDILVFTIMIELSGTYNSAIMGKKMYLQENPHKNITIIDSHQGSTPIGVMAVKAARMLEEGKTVEEIVEESEIWKREAIHYGTLETLENAIKGGRVNRIAGKIINALNFKAIIHIGNHQVKPIDKARGELNSLKKVIEYVEKDMKGEKKIIGIAHANCPEKAEKVKKMVEENLNYSEIIIAEIGPVMGTYTAEGAILVSAM